MLIPKHITVRVLIPSLFDTPDIQSLSVVGHRANGWSWHPHPVYIQGRLSHRIQIQWVQHLPFAQVFADIPILFEYELWGNIAFDGRL
jgi:hypothetical protein